MINRFGAGDTRCQKPSQFPALVYSTHSTALSYYHHTHTHTHTHTHAHTYHQQDSTVDTSSLVANVSNAINSSLMSLDSIESSSVEASGNLFSLEQQTTEVDQAEMQIAIGSNLTINSEMLFSELNTSVNGLQDALQSIIKVNPAKLNNINDLIQDADDMTMSVDIAALYQSLNASLVAQQQRRNNLEQELASLEEEVAYFKNIMSILPEDCDSNL